MNKVLKLRNVMFKDLRARLSNYKLTQLKKTADSMLARSPFFKTAWYIQYTYILSSIENRTALSGHYHCNDLEELSQAILQDFRKVLYGPNI